MDHVYRLEFDEHLRLFFDPVGEYAKGHIASFICIFLALIKPLMTEGDFQSIVNLFLNGSFVDILQDGGI